VTHYERLEEIKKKLAENKPILIAQKIWGKEHVAMEYMIERIERLTLALEIVSRCPEEKYGLRKIASEALEGK
jgi:hypothetical protein